MSQLFHDAKGRTFTPEESFRVHLSKAKEALEKRDLLLLAVSTGTIAVVAAKAKMDEISQIALSATRAARAGYEKITRDTLSELSITIEAKLKEINLSKNI